MRKEIGFVVVVGALAAACWVAAAAERDPTTGRQIAERWCAECHAIGAGRMQSPVPEAPSFAAMAQDPATTELALRTILVTSHANMPNIRLTPEQNEEVAVYILSLRRR